MLYYQIIYSFNLNEFYAIKWCGIRNGRRDAGRPSRKKINNILFCSYYVSLYKWISLFLLISFCVQLCLWINYRFDFSKLYTSFIVWHQENMFLISRKRSKQEIFWIFLYHKFDNLNSCIFWYQDMEFLILKNHFLTEIPFLISENNLHYQKISLTVDMTIFNECSPAFSAKTFTVVLRAFYQQPQWLVCSKAMFLVYHDLKQKIK